MAQSFTGKKRIRKSFGKIAEAVTMPNLIEVQKSSYDQFLQKDVPQEMRRDEGIEAVSSLYSRSRISKSALFWNMSLLSLSHLSLTWMSVSSAT